MESLEIEGAAQEVTRGTCQHLISQQAQNHGDEKQAPMSEPIQEPRRQESALGLM
jgi:hypothetical protein